MARDTLSIEEARRIALSAQGLRGARVTTGGVPGMVRRLGAVQLDTISVLARSHELVAYARLGRRGTGTSRAGLLGAQEWDIRVLVPRRLRAAARGLAGLYVQTPGLARQGEALALVGKAGQDVRRGGGPSARRGPVDRERARGRQEGRSVVGLVRDQDRGGVVARRRRAGLPRAPRFRARLRPRRAGHSGRAAASGMERRGVCAAAGRGGGAFVGRGNGGRPGAPTTGCRARWCAVCWMPPG